MWEEHGYSLEVNGELHKPFPTLEEAKEAARYYQAGVKTLRIIHNSYEGLSEIWECDPAIQEWRQLKNSQGPSV